MINYTRFVTAAVTGFLTANAQTAEEKAAYPEWAANCEALGFEWKPYTVETQDGWFLTLFRITSTKSDVPIDYSKPPVFLQHGAGQNSYAWLGGNPLGYPTLPGALAERGYDVWMGDNRGTQYSDRNINDDTWTIKEHWDFDWSEQGTYDIPAFVDKIIEVSEKPKVTLMGYSTGGAQIFYALAKNQDYYAERVNRFVGLSACQYYNAKDPYYDTQVSLYLKLREQGVYNFYGDDAGSLSADNCAPIGPDQCAEAGYGGMLQATATNTFLYFHQIAVEGRFQEPIPLDDWARGQHVSPLVDLTKIDRVPVSIVHAVQDETCEPTMMEWAYMQVQSPDKHLIFEHGGHVLFSYEWRSAFVDRMVLTIENGATDAASSLMNTGLLSGFALLAATSALF